MECIQKAWYCTNCCLQFDSKFLYELHIKLVHVQQILTKHITTKQKTNVSFNGGEGSLSKSTFAKQKQLHQEVTNQKKDKIFKCK